MATIHNENEETHLERIIAPSTNKPQMNPDSLAIDSICPPSKPSNKNNSKAVEKYKKDLRKCANYLLREVRVEIQEVVRILDEHVAGNLDIKSHLEELDSSNIDVDTILNDLKNKYLSRMDPEDLYSEIINLWQMAQGNPYFDKTKREEFLKQQEQDRLREINILKNRLSRLVFLIEYSTGIERVNSWIEGTRVGYALPFHNIFEDEIKLPEDRQKILNLYSLQPKSIIGGLVDPVKGVILCYPKGSFDRLIRHTIITLFFVLTFFVVYYMGAALSGQSNFRNLLGVEKTDQLFLLMCWAAMLVGVAGHILVTSAKTSNAEFRQFPLPLRDWDYYISARTTMILYKLTLAIFIFLSMFVLLKGKLELLDAFLIGYSFDSVVELVGVSLEKRSAGSVNAIKERL